MLPGAEKSPDEAVSGPEPVARALPLPPLKEWVLMALFLSALAGLHVYDLHRRGMRLSTTPFIDPAGVIQVTSWDIYTARRLRSGEFPLWNPLTGVGQPHLANLQTAVFYPLKLPFYLTGGLGGHDVYLFLRLVLLALGPFVLLRALGVGVGGSAFGSVAFGFGGYSLWFINLVELNNQALTPFLMIALAALGTRMSRRRFFAAAGLLAVDILGGHPEGIFISVLFSGLFAVFWVLRGHAPVRERLASLKGAAGRWAAAGVLSVMAAAAVMIPFAEYFPRAWNFHFAGMGFLHLGPKALFNVLSPFFGRLVFGSVIQLPQGLLDMSMTDFYRLPYGVFQLHAGLPYTGLIVSAFMVAAVIGWKHLPKGGGFFAVFWIAAVLFSMGIFPFKLLSFIPPFHVTNNAKFYFAEITLCACLLAGMGVDAMSRGASRMVPIALLMGFITAATVIRYSFGLDIPEIYVQMLAAAVLTGALISLKKWRAWAALAMLIAELAFMKTTVKPYLPVDWGKAQDAKWPLVVSGVGAEAESDSKTGISAGWGGYRFQVEEDFLMPPNLNLIRGIADIRSSDAMFPRAYFDWIDRIGGIEGEDALRDFYPRYYTRLNDMALASRDAAIMGLKYLVSEKPLDQPEPYEPAGKPDDYVYERADVCPLVFYWMDARRSCDPADISGRAGMEKVLFESAGTDGNMPLVFNELSYPGWRARRNSTPLKPQDIGIPLQAYAAEGGGGKYQIEYRPYSFAIGLWTSVVTLIFGLGLFFRGEVLGR